MLQLTDAGKIIVWHQFDVCLNMTDSDFGQVPRDEFQMQIVFF